MSNIGKKILELRTARGWSQEQLAAKSGVGQSTIGHLESGRNKNSTLLPKIAVALGTSTEELTGIGSNPTTRGLDLELLEDMHAQRRYVISRTGAPEIDGEHAYEVEPDDVRLFLFPIPDDRMAPRYMRGDYAIVEPNTQADIEDDVLVKLATGEVALHRLLSRRNGLRLGSWNEQAIRTYEEGDVDWIYYVAGFVPGRKIKVSEFVKRVGRLPRPNDEL